MEFAEALLEELDYLCSIASGEKLRIYNVIRNVVCGAVNRLEESQPQDKPKTI
jgi:hypothetical protein